jgi:hypothetical protein
MSLQQYLNNDVLATISDTVSGTLTTINIFAVPMVMAKSGDVVFIINKGTGRQYQVTLTADLDTSLNRITFSSTTFDTPIPEGSIVIQKQVTKYTNLFRKYTTVNIPIVNAKNGTLFDMLRDDTVFPLFNQSTGTTLSDGDSVDADFATLHNSFLTPTNGAKIENIKYTLNTNSGTGKNCTISLFELPIAVNSNSSQTISLIEAQSFTSQNDATYNFFTNSTPNHDLAANTCIMVAFKRTGTATSSDIFRASVELLISFDPR